MGEGAMYCINYFHLWAAYMSWNLWQFLPSQQRNFFLQYFPSKQIIQSDPDAKIKCEKVQFLKTVKAKVIYFNVCKLYFYNFWYGIPCIVETKLHFSSNSMYATTRQKKINPQINFHTVLNFLFVCTGAVFSFYSNWIILQIKWKFKLYSMV